MFWKSEFYGVLLEGVSRDNVDRKVMYISFFRSVTYSTMNLVKQKNVVMHATANG